MDQLHKSQWSRHPFNLKRIANSKQILSPRKKISNQHLWNRNQTLSKCHLHSRHRHSRRLNRNLQRVHNLELLSPIPLSRLWRFAVEKMMVKPFRSTQIQIQATILLVRIEQTLTSLLSVVITSIPLHRMSLQLLRKLQLSRYLPNNQQLKSIHLQLPRCPQPNRSSSKITHGSITIVN